MNPPRCIECLCWHKQDGKAWWLGYCTVTGEAVGFRTTCQLPEWQKKLFSTDRRIENGQRN